jgi:hypothetical protein
MGRQLERILDNLLKNFLLVKIVLEGGAIKTRAASTRFCRPVDWMVQLRELKWTRSPYLEQTSWTSRWL